MDIVHTYDYVRFKISCLHLCLNFLLHFVQLQSNDFTHFCVSSVHLKAVQFAFALQISFQVHEMGFNFH